MYRSSITRVYHTANYPATRSTSHQQTSQPLKQAKNLPQVPCSSGEQASQPTTSKSSSASQQPPKIWTEDEEKALVSTRISKDKEFCAGIKDHRQIWKRIQRELAELKIEATPTQIVNKWNQLKKRYKEVKDHNRKTGNDPKYFKYSTQLDMLYGEKASTTPAFIIDSLTGESGSDDISSKGTRKSSKSKVHSHSETAQEIEEAPPAARKRGSEGRLKHLQIMEEMLQLTQNMAEEAQKSRDAKMVRMDRFLDIFEKSVTKSSTEQ